MGGRVLGFVQDNDGIIEGSPTHKGQRGYLDDIVFHIFLQLDSRNHILQGIVERLQVRIEFVFHLSGQESQLLTRFHRRTAQDNLAHFLILQGFHGKGNGHKGFSRSGRTRRKDQVVFLECLDQ